MKIFTSKDIHEIDGATCEAQQISSLQLMERAASKVSCELITKFLPTQRFVVMAGPGNNGGDALAIARMLYEHGYRKIEVFFFNVTGKISLDCEEERKKLITIDGFNFNEVSKEFNPPTLGSSDVVIDGLFGSGLTQPLTGGFVAVSRLINESGAYVISIDVPSGMFSEWNNMLNRRDIIHADKTYVFQIPRLSFFFEENYNLIGDWEILDINLDSAKIKELPTFFRLVESRNIRPLLKKRLPFTAKRDYGSVLIFAGRSGMMGAAVMCARATLKSGAGLVTVHSGNAGLLILQTAVPEAMYEPDRAEHFITDMRTHHEHQAIAIGPGLGCKEQTMDALENFLRTCSSPLVLDADALNCISLRPSMLSLLPAKTIITPHIGEFDRLFGEHNSSEARLQKAIEMSKQYNIVIVLKGHYTMTVWPSGRVNINPTGNPGMATAGAGDVLTGIIASFLAQGYKPEYAALIGVFVHGVAGDIAAENIGEFGVTAGDIITYTGKAINAIFENKI